jgi:aminopeptidase-like protein
VSKQSVGEDIFGFAQELWPFPRSLTGEGTRATLNKINEKLPNLKRLSYPSGEQVFDWVIPKEWHVRAAYIITPDGKKICDFHSNNLHLVGYSIPFRGFIDLEELQTHLHSLPEKPDAIPYITSYYQKRWGFCISDNERKRLQPGQYQIVVDSNLFDGTLDFGELVIPGKSDKEVFFSTYVCHPSMANNELSGPCLATYLAKYITELESPPNYTYRFIFIPETIGSIAYLSKNLSNLKSNVIAGFNITCVGDERCFSYLPSKSGDTFADQVAHHCLKWTDDAFKRYTWLDRGSDERQYCSPGIDLPVVSVMRSKYGTYPEYHTSLDTLGGVVTPRGFAGSYQLYLRMIEVLETNCIPIVNVLCEPQMGKRNLYSQKTTGERHRQTKNMMNLLSYCDGKFTLFEIAEKINVPYWDCLNILSLLIKQSLVRLVNT